MKTITVEGTIKTEVGKKVNADLRKEGLVPCVIYGGKENIHFSTLGLDLRDIVFTNKLRIAEIKLDGKSYKCIVKDIQFHPVSEKILHVDFQELQDGKKVKVMIPITTTGLAEGVRNGGTLALKMRYINVKVKPENMVEQFEVDVTDLNIGKSIKVSEIDFGGLEVLDNPAFPVARIAVPRAVKAEGEGIEGEEEDEGEEGEEGGEGAEGAAAEAPAAEEKPAE